MTTLSKVIAPQYNNLSMVADYTNEINVIPTMFGRINQMGLFGFEGVAADTVIIDRVVNSLGILQVTGRGGPATREKGERNSSLALPIPYFRHEDFLRPEDLINRRAPGMTGPDTITRKRMKKITLLRRKIVQTLEWLKLGAIKGQVTDGAGSTLLDIYSEFGITQTVLSFALSNTATDVGAKVRELKRAIEANLLSGDMVDLVHCFVDSGFFDALVSHPNVEKAYQQFATINQIAAPGAGATAGQMGGQQPLQADLRRSFVFQGVVFEEYNPGVSLIQNATSDDTQATLTRLIASNEGYAFPMDIPEMFEGYYAPANKMQYVGTEGAEMYSFEYQLPNDEGMMIEGHTAPLFVNRRPAAVIRLQAG